MNPPTKKEKIRYLEKRLEKLKKQLEVKAGRSQYAFEHGGDGWHDNASWEGVCQDVGVLSALIRNTKEELNKLKKRQ
ncbi:MAG: hypothetical protein U9M98_01170 [Patescibacteria group bacterium]|nr:hypothetical protein [Patescibacteria group bacterium]